MGTRESWATFKELRCEVPELDLSLDSSRMGFPAGYLAAQAPAIGRAFAAMDALEAGAIANPDEQRMVGHYWLRDPARAPQAELRREIEGTVAKVKALAADVHAGRVRPPGAARFTQLLCVGIGGSALGPMFVADALGSPGRDRLAPHFLDNTDPDGIARVLASLGPKLGGDAGGGHLQERRHARDAQRDAGGAGGLPRGRPRLRPARGGHHPGRLEAGRGGGGRGVAGPLPDVGLGRRPHQRDLGGGPPAGRAAGPRHGRPAGGGAAVRRGHAPARHRPQPGRGAGADLAPRHGRQGRPGHGGAALQGLGSCSSAATCSSW